MAGLLDFLASPESQLGIGLLAAANSGMGLGQGLLSATQSVAAQRRTGLQDKLLQSQVDENTSQAEMRKQQLAMAQRQAAMEQAYFGGGSLPGQTTQGAGMIGSAAPQAAQGAMAQGAAPRMGKFDEWSAQFGIPKDALIVDYLKNGGKGIAEMIAKRGTPDMQVTNGYAYDKNRLGAGFLPFLSTSQNGITSMGRIGPDGLPVITAPQGALDTYNSYQGAQANFKPIKVYNPQTGREEYSSEGAVVGASRGGGQPSSGGPSGYAGGSRDAATQEQILMVQNELSKLPANHPDRPALSREIARLQGMGPRTQSGNYAAGPSASEVALNDAARARAVDTAKADVVRDTDRTKTIKSANEMLGDVTRAKELLQSGPTASGAGELVDKGMSFFGRSTKGAEVAAQLDVVAGSLTKNVPRMEGPQSDGDREEYKTQAGRVANRSLPVQQRLAAANEVERLQRKYASFNGGTSNQGGAEGSWDAPSKPSSGGFRIIGVQ